VRFKRAFQGILTVACTLVIASEVYPQKKPPPKSTLGSASSLDGQWTGKTLQVAPGNVEALALRAHASAARRECVQALADLAALPQAELDARQELRGDRFVCLVENKDWPGAEAAAKAVPADLSTRSDVAQAQKRLAAERPSQSKALASKTGEVSKTSMKSPSSPGTDGGAVPAKAPDTTAPVSAPEKKPAGVPPAQKKAAVSAPEKKAVAVSAPEKKPAEDASKRLPPRAPEALAESRRLVQARKAAEAEKILLEALKSEPENRELRLALLEASCLSGAWNRGAEQLPRVAPFAEGEALPMFYAAVVLYESGHPKEARTYFERSAQKVSGPLVDEYSKKILERR